MCDQHFPALKSWTGRGGQRPTLPGAKLESKEWTMDNQQQSERTYEIAKEALALIGKFKTPPIPTIYEIWFRYAEGENEAICSHLSHAINETKSVTTDSLLKLHQQFCTPSEDVTERIGLELTDELEQLQSMVSSQMHATDQFNSSITDVSATLSGLSEQPDSVGQCVAQLLASNRVMQDRLQEMDERLQESQAHAMELQRDYQESQKAMMMDPLTGVGNRRFFDNYTRRAIETLKNRKNLLFLMLIDLDKFKHINDTFGHDSGDFVLQFVADKLNNVREGVSVARFGGDEFAVFYESNRPEDAYQVAEELRAFFSNAELTFGSTGELLGTVGLSIGIARLRPDDTSDSWFRRADSLLYEAKSSGRNCVMAERQLAGT